MMTRVVLLQSNYLPWRGYFDLIHDADLFLFYDQAKYTKNDWRNRNRIYAPGGAHWLTIPVSAESVRLRIDRVRVDGYPWQERHHRALLAAYGGAPRFGDLAPLLEETYLKRRWTWLSELNQHLIGELARGLGLDTPLRAAPEVLAHEAGDRVDRLLAVLQAAGATHYLSGPAARDYLAGREDDFERAGIALEFKRYPDYMAYPQRRAPFEPAVSVVDLIANVGWERAPGLIWGER
jgi:hypothetical protein